MRRRLLEVIGPAALDALAAEVASGELDPYTAADSLIRVAGLDSSTPL